VYEPPVDRGGPRLSPPRVTAGASLRTTVSLLAQEVFELVHQLLRGEVIITAWARRLVTRRVIGLLELPHLGLGRGVLGPCLVGSRTRWLRLAGEPLKVRKPVSIWDSGMRRVSHAAAPAPLPAAHRTPALQSHGDGAAVAQSLLEKTHEHVRRLYPRLRGAAEAGVAPDQAGQ
jgi:hypothetical protein